MSSRRALAAAALVALCASGTATAHIDVLPVQITEGEATRFTVRVPNERPGLDTTVVKVAFPEGVTVYSFLPPPPGWTSSVQTAPNGRVSGVTYRGRLGPEQFEEFVFLGNAFTAGKGMWKSWQTYSDGKVKPWTLDPKDETDAQETGPTDPGPASPLTIVKAGAAAPSSATAEAPAAATGSSGESGAGVWLGLAGIGMGALALLVAGFLWATRPMRLPDD